MQPQPVASPERCRARENEKGPQGPRIGPQGRRGNNMIHAERTTADELLLDKSNTVLFYGKKVLVASKFYRGTPTPQWSAAIYSDLLGDPRTGELWLDKTSPWAYDDNGHAMAWAIAEAQKS